MGKTSWMHCAPERVPDVTGLWRCSCVHGNIVAIRERAEISSEGILVFVRAGAERIRLGQEFKVIVSLWSEVHRQSHHCVTGRWVITAR